MSNDVEKIVEEETIVKESYFISGKVLDLLKGYAASTFLSRHKYNILKLVIDNDKEISIDEIHKKFKLSKPLIAYHMNGNLKNDGMIKNELVTSTEIKGKTYYKITDFGKFIFKFAKLEESLMRK